MTDAPVADRGPLVPRPALAPVPGRLELPHRPGARGQRRRPGRRPAGLRATATGAAVRGGQAAARAAPFGPARHRRLHALGIPVPANYSAPSYAGAAGDARRPPAGASASATSSSRSARASSGRTSRATSRRAPTASPATSGSATTGQRADVRRPRDSLGRAGRDARAGPQRRDRLERPGVRAVRRVRAGRPGEDQGQLHARRHARPRRVRLRADRPDRDGQRLQRLHRDVPRVPARRPLPQGADRLGPALERLPRHAARADGPGAQAATRRRAGRARRRAARARRRSPTRRTPTRRRAALGEVAARRGRRPTSARCPTTAATPEVRRRSPRTSSASTPRSCSWRGGVELRRRPARGRRAARRRRAGSPYGDQTGEVVDDREVPGAGARRSRTSPAAQRVAVDGDVGGVRRPRRRSPTRRASGRAATPAGDLPLRRRRARGATGGETVPYELASRRSRCAPWSGITVDACGLRRRRARRSASGPAASATGTLDERENGGDAGRRARSGRSTTPTPTAATSSRASSSAGRTVVRDPAAPDDASRWEWYCLDCSFRPWLDAGDADAVTRDGHRRRRHAARAWPPTPAGDGALGRAPRPLRRGRARARRRRRRPRRLRQPQRRSRREPSRG